MTTNMQDPTPRRPRPDATPDATESAKNAALLHCRVTLDIAEGMAREAARTNTTRSALLARAAAEFLARRPGGPPPPSVRERGAGGIRVSVRLEAEELQFADAYAAREHLSRSAAVGDVFRTGRAQTDRSVPAGEAARLLEKVLLIEQRTEQQGRALGAILLLLVHCATKICTEGTSDADELLADARAAGDGYWDAIEDALGRRVR